MNAIDREKLDRKNLDFGPIGIRVVGALQRGLQLSLEDSLSIVERLRVLYRLGLEDADVLLPIAYPQICQMGRLLSIGFRSVLPTCLDYSYVVGRNGRKRYTFESIGSGVSANAQTLLEKTPVLFQAIREAGAELVEAAILVSDVEAADEIYQVISGLDEVLIREQGRGTVEAIRVEISNEIGMLSVGLMSEMVDLEDKYFGEEKAAEIKTTAKQAIGSSRRSLYETMFDRSIEVGRILESGHPFEFHDFLISRVTADLQRYISFGAACRRRGAAIVDATAPEVATYYNIGAGVYPVTPYIRIIDDYE